MKKKPSAKSANNPKAKPARALAGKRKAAAKRTTPAKKAATAPKKATSAAKKAPAVAKKAKAATAKTSPKAPRKPKPDGQRRRWRGTGPRPRIVVDITFLTPQGDRWIRVNSDEIEYTDTCTGEDYTIASGSTIDSGYNFSFPEENPGAPVDATIMIDAGENTDPWMTYTCDNTDPNAVEDTLTVDLYQVDEFIEYYEPDPCDGYYQMSNGSGSWGIVG